MLSIIILAIVLIGALLMIPLGLPGTWVMVAAAIVFSLAVPQSGIGAVTICGTAALAMVAELIEFFLVARLTKRYGGSRRAAWGAVIGGFAGVIVGVPVPVIGSVIGGFIGSFLGALIGEYEAIGDHRAATRVAVGAVLARVVTSATKVGIGVGIAVWIVVAASRTPSLV